MNLLDELIIGNHRIELYHGDLVAMPPEHAVDVLVVSSNPGRYGAVKKTLIGALHDNGVTVKELAQNKQVDLRDQFGCWLSHPLERPDLAFKRVLCFEPAILGKTGEVVGEIFQSLLPFVYGDTAVRSLAMPLVGTGVQRYDLIDVLDNLLKATVNWFLLDLPLHTIKLVETNERKAYEMKGAFSVLKRAYADQTSIPNTTPEYRYDIFISYSHKNKLEAQVIHDELLRANPNLRIFIDHAELNTGAAWQQSLYEALDDCHRVIAVLSPHYLMSKVCKEEYNIALARHREQGSTVLSPIYLYSAPLPTYMQMIQFADCREFNRAAIREACEVISTQ